MHIYFKLQVCIALQEVHPYFERGGGWLGEDEGWILGFKNGDTPFIPLILISFLCGNFYQSSGCESIIVLEKEGRTNV